MIRAVIFDMDGILVETESVHMRAFARFMEDKGFELPAGYVHTLVGFSIHQNIETLKRDFGLAGDSDALARERNLLYLGMLASVPLEPLPGVMEFFDLAETRGLKKAVCSSSERAQLDVVLPRLLSALGRDSRPETFFDAIVSGNDVKLLKPAPDIYLECARRLGAPPGQCLAVEDSPAGAASAAAAGIPLIVVPGEYTSPSHDWPTRYVFKSLADAVSGGVINITEDAIRANGTL